MSGGPTGSATGSDPSPYLAQLEGIIAAVERDLRQSQPREAEAAERRAAAARKGELGEDWLEVQRRIDAGHTSLMDVFGGQDETPAARRLAELSRRNLAELGERLREQDAGLRAELAEVDDELAWLSEPASPAPVVSVDPMVRSATDPTVGVGPAPVDGVEPPA